MWTTNEANMKLVLHLRIGCCSLLITTTVSLLENEFEVPKHIARASELAAVNHISVIREVMNGCKSKDSLKACFENLIIKGLLLKCKYLSITPIDRFSCKLNS